MSGRPWLTTVWERSFTTEDEADEAYEEFLEKFTAPFEVDRFDGNTIRIYLDTAALESAAQLVEARFEPPIVTTMCRCGHVAIAHRGEESACTVVGCDCTAFYTTGG